MGSTSLGAFSIWLAEALCTWCKHEVSPALNRCLELLTSKSPFQPKSFRDSMKIELVFIAEYSRVVGLSLENIPDQYCLIRDAVGSGLRQSNSSLFEVA